MRWQEYTDANTHAGEWQKLDVFSTFTRYLAEYLCSAPVLEQLISRLLGVISLQNRDELARKNARRKFTRLILNDFVMNPGSDTAPLGDMGNRKGERDYGLMTPFIDRWLGASSRSTGIPSGRAPTSGFRRGTRVARLAEPLPTRTFCRESRFLRRATLPDDQSPRPSIHNAFQQDCRSCMSSSPIPACNTFANRFAADLAIRRHPSAWGGSIANCRRGLAVADCIMSNGGLPMESCSWRSTLHAAIQKKDTSAAPMLWRGITRFRSPGCWTWKGSHWPEFPRLNS